MRSMSCISKFSNSVYSRVGSIELLHRSVALYSEMPVFAQILASSPVTSLIFLDYSSNSYMMILFLVYPGIVSCIHSMIEYNAGYRPEA